MGEWLVAEKIAEIQHLRRQGLSVADIAREAGVSQNMVYSHVRGITETYDGKPLRIKRRATEGDKERIRALWLEGNSTQDIAERTGFSSSTVSLYTKDIGRADKPRRWVYTGQAVRAAPSECRACRWRMNKAEKVVCAVCWKKVIDRRSTGGTVKEA